MDEVTELAENNAELTAEETTTEVSSTEESSTEETTLEAEAVQADESPVAEAAVAEEVSADETSDAAPQEDQSADATPEAEAASTPSNAPARDADGFSNALPSIEGDETPRKHVVGGIGYEIIYVVRTGDQKVLEITGQRVRELIEDNEGAIDNVRASEVRRFAYPIKKQTEGVYVVINARFKPELTKEMDRFFKLEESVLRHMMLKEDN